MSRGPDALTLVERLLQHHAARRGIDLAITAASATPWASATFAGAQHRLTLVASDDAAFQCWLDDLAEMDLPIHGHLVADAAVVSRMPGGGALCASVEILTVEER